MFIILPFAYIFQMNVKVEYVASESCNIVDTVREVESIEVINDQTSSSEDTSEDQPTIA